MSLREKLKDLSGYVSIAATDAPDEYPDWGYITYESNMTYIKELWVDISPRLKKDIEKANFVDHKLVEMFVAFEAGDKAKGRQAAWDIYNSEVEKLR